MSYIKKLLAVVLILTMTLGLVVSGYALTSPGGGPVAPGETVVTEKGTVTLYDVSDDGTAEVEKVTQDPANPSKTAKLDGGDNPITSIGDGSKGVFSSKTGKKITKVVVDSTKRVEITKKAFKGSNVKKIQMKNQKTTIRKDAFSGTKKKTVTLELKSAKKASDIKVSKGSFNGLSSDSRIVVSKANMSKKEFNKLEKKLRDAGFTGSIVRK